VGLQFEPYAVVKDKDAARLWAMANGFERTLQMPWQTLNAEVKERLLNGLAEPDGVVAHSKPKLVRRRG
jgi:hypothetical protein